MPVDPAKIAARYLFATRPIHLTATIGDVLDHLSMDVQSTSSLVTVQVFVDQQVVSELVSDGGQLHDYPGWKSNQVGLLTATTVRNRDELDDECFEDLEWAERRSGKTLSPFQIKKVELVKKLRGLGLGSDLYIKAAKEIAQYDGALVPDRCGPAGVTTGQAERVWESSTIRQQLEVVGNNVMWFQA